MNHGYTDGRVKWSRQADLSDEGFVASLEGGNAWASWHLQGGVVVTYVSTNLAANSSVFMPFWLEKTVIVDRLIWLPIGTTGNYDVGLYDSNGVKIVSKGSTATPGTGATSVAASTFGSDITLTPGCYWAGFAASATTVTFLGSNQFDTSGARQYQFRLYRETSTFPLPSSMSFPASQTSTFPFYYILAKSYTIY